MLAVASRQEQKAQTRQSILDNAYALFAQRGIMATTTADVARAAGVSHGSVFAHFPSRDDLITAVVGDWGDRAANAVRRLSGRDASVRTLLAAHLRQVAEDEAFYTRLVLEGPFLPRDARRMIVGIQSAISAQMATAFAAEIKVRRIKAIAPDLAFNTWIGLLHHYLANRDLFAPKGSVIARLGDRLLEHYLQLIASNEGGKRK